MKKTKTNKKEQEFNREMSALATIKQVFAALALAHGLDVKESMTVLTLFNHAALKVMSKGLHKPISEVYEHFKDGLDAAVNFEEKEQENEQKK